MPGRFARMLPLYQRAQSSRSRSLVCQPAGRALNIGDVYIGAVDAEVYNTIAQRQKRESPCKHTMLLLAACLLLVGTSVPSRAAEVFKVPRTTWGDPIIQGTYTNNTNVPFERPAALGDKAFYTEQEYEARRHAPVIVETTTVVTDVHYELTDYGLDPTQNQMVRNLRTSILTSPANGRMPPLRADARQRGDAARAAQQARAFDSAQDRPLQERCLLWAHEGPPLRPVGYNTHVQIMQGRDHVVLVTEMVHDARVIPLFATRPDFGGLTRWQGNSWGRWQAGTLVIETSGITDKVFPRGAGVPLGPEGRVIEKITRTGPKTIRYEFTVSDPSLWDVAWGGEFPMELSDEPMFEYACHEGNYGLANTLRGVREEEKSNSGEAR
jgi:hypothetical protein